MPSVSIRAKRYAVRRLPLVYRHRNVFKTPRRRAATNHRVNDDAVSAACICALPFRH